MSSPRPEEDDASFLARLDQQIGFKPTPSKRVLTVSPDEDYAIRTVIGEAQSQNDVGRQAVAGVIRNRANGAKQSFKDVVLAPSQFEPWSHDKTRNYIQGIKTDSPLYKQIATTVLPVLRGEAPDPTKGATHFYAPKAQSALGRPTPDFDNGKGVDIGDHRFFNLGYSGKGRHGTKQGAPKTFAPNPDDASWLADFDKRHGLDAPIAPVSNNDDADFLSQLDQKLGLANPAVDAPPQDAGTVYGMPANAFDNKGQQPSPTIAAPTMAQPVKLPDDLTIDMNQPVPETAETIQAQTEAAKNPASSRLGVLPTTDEQIAQFANDPTMTIATMKNGKQIAINTAEAKKSLKLKSPKDIQTWASLQEPSVVEERVIGTPQSANVGDATGNDQPVIATYDKKGNELVSTVAPQGSEQAVIASHKKQFPHGKQVATTTDEVAAQRLAPIADEYGNSVPLPEGVDTTAPTAPVQQPVTHKLGQPAKKVARSAAQVPPTAQPVAQPVQPTQASESEYQKWRDYMKLDDSPESRQQFQQALAVAPNTEHVDVSANPSDFSANGEKLTDMALATPTTGGEGYVPKEVGKQSDDLKQPAYRFRADDNLTPEQAAKAAYENAAKANGVNADWNTYKKSMVGKEIIAPDYQPGDTIEVNYKALQQGGADIDLRTKQVQDRIDRPNLSVSHDWIADDAKALKETFGETAGAGIAEILASGGRRAEELAGVLRFVDLLSPTRGESLTPTGMKRESAGTRFIEDLQNEGSDTRKLSEVSGGKNIRYDENGRPIISDDLKAEITKTIAGLPVDIGAAVIYSLLPGGNATAFGLQNAGGSYGRGESGEKALKEGAKGVATGAVLGAASKFTKWLGPKAAEKLLSTETKAALESPANVRAYEAAKAAGEKVELSPDLKRALAVKAITEKGLPIGIVTSAGYAASALAGGSRRDNVKSALTWGILHTVGELYGAKNGKPTREAFDKADETVIRVPDTEGKTKDILLLKGKDGELKATDVTGIVPEDVVENPKVSDETAKGVSDFIPKIEDTDLSESEKKPKIPEGVLGPKVEPASDFSKLSKADKEAAIKASSEDVAKTDKDTSEAVVKESLTTENISQKPESETQPDLSLTSETQVSPIRSRAKEAAGKRIGKKVEAVDPIRAEAKTIAETIKGEVVGSASKPEGTPNAIDIRIDEYSPKIESKMTDLGYEYRGSSLVSPEEAKASGKPYADGWQRAQHFENKKGQSIDIWHNEPEANPVSPIETKEPVSEKQPHEMTRAEFTGDTADRHTTEMLPKVNGASIKARNNAKDADHRAAVESAIARGKDVPDSVLADYPWLAADKAIKPYVDNLANLSDTELKAESERASKELNSYASSKRGELPGPGDQAYFEISNKFNAVNHELDTRKSGVRMTQQQYFDDWLKNSPIAKADQAAFLADKKAVANIRKQTDAGHRRIIEDAVAKNKPVPAEVLADYPALAAKAKLATRKAEKATALEAARQKIADRKMAVVERRDKSLRSTPAFERRDVQLPSRNEVEDILRSHPLIGLRERVKNIYIVGSYAKGNTHPTSDLDVLLEVSPKKDYTAEELEEKYRRKLQQYFVTNDIRGQNDSVHPQWNGHRVDVYFTYDASTENRPKVLLSTNSKTPTEVNRYENEGDRPLDALRKVRDPASLAAIESLRDADLTDVLPRVQTSVTGDENGRNILSFDNAEAGELARTLYEFAEDQKTPLFDGAYLNSEKTQAFIDATEGVRDAAQEAGLDTKSLDDLLKNWTEASKENKGVRVEIFSDSRGHETIHQQSEMGADGKSFEARYANAKELKADPVFQKFHKALDKLQGKSSHGVAMEESLAYLASGDYTRFGLTENEAVELVAKLVTGYADANGLDSLKTFNNTEAYGHIESYRQKQSSQTSDDSGSAVDTQRQAEPEATEVQRSPGDTGEQGETRQGKSKVGRSIEADAIEKGLTEGFEGTAEYDKITFKEQGEKVADLLNNDFEKASRILNGIDRLPNDIRGSSLIIGLENRAKATGDVELLREIARSPLVSETSRHAQELGLLRQRSPYSPAKLIQEIEDVKKAKSEKRGKSEKKVVDEIKDAAKPKRQSKRVWADLINSLKC